MKVTSGVMHPLRGQDVRSAGTTQRAPGVRPRVERPTRSPTRAAAPVAVAGGRDGRPGRLRGGTVLTVAASVVLLGCSTLTSTPWRIEPTYRLEPSGSDTAPGFLALARQYEGEGRHAQALDAYRRAAQVAPADADVQNTLGLALARNAQYTGAVTALRRAVALAPERPQLLNNLGYALLLGGQTEDARAIFRLTLAVDPAHEMASRNLAHVEQQLALAAAKAAPQPAATVSAPVPAAAPATLAPVTPALAQTSPVPSPLEPERTRLEVPESRPAQSIAVGATPMAAEAPRAPLQDVSVEIVNGNGVSGAAARMRLWLQERGIRAGRLTNLPPYTSAQTVVLYRPGKASEAHEMVKHMPVGADVAPASTGSTRSDLRVVIGHDARHSAGCAALKVCAPAERLASSVAWQGQMPENDGKVQR